MTRRTIAWLVVVAFLVNLTAGNLLRPGSLQAYDAPPKDQGHDGSVMVAAGEGKPPSEVCVKRASPVSVRTGDYAYSHQDLFISGRGLPLQVTRTYNSQDSYDGPFGYGWKFNLEIRLAVASNGAQEVVTVRDGGGVRVEFTRNPDGSYQAPPGRLDQLKKNAGGSYTWSQNGCGSCAVPLYQFDASGYLASIQDPNGNQQTFSYDAAGRLKQVKDAVGRSLKISYGTNNKIAVITDPADRTFTYTYDDTGNLKTYTDPAGNVTTYNYDAGHNLTSMVDARGNTITTITYDNQDRAVGYTEFGGTWTYSYNPTNRTTYKYLPNSWYAWQYIYNNTGQVTTEQDPNYNMTTYTYNDKIYLTSVKDARGYTTTFQYDDRGNRTAITDALGNTTTIEYHPTLNRVISVTDALGRKTTVAYDDRGNLVKMTDAMGSQTALTYDEVGQLTKITDALGQSTTFAYDAYGGLTSITNAMGNVMAYTRDILGNLLQVKDAKGNATTFTHDALGNMTSVKNALGGTTTYSYDKNSNIVNIVNASGEMVSYEYDMYNNVIKSKDPIGNVRLTEYDDYGNTAKRIDPHGYIINYVYDLIGRIVTINYANIAPVNYTYDSAGNVLTRKDAKENVTTYAYNALNKLTQVTYADGSTETFTYDKVENVVSRKDQIGNVIAFAYDDANRLISKTYPDTAQAIYAHDALGRLTSATFGGNTVALSYDAINRIIKTVQGADTVSYTYDKVGNKTKIVYPDKSYLTYSFDPLNRLTKIKDSRGNEIANFIYDKLSRRTNLKLANGTEAVYKYDASHRLTSLTNKKSASNQNISKFEYGYDKLFNITSMTTQAGSYSYTYDTIYQLIKATYPGSKETTYNLDSVGNRVSVGDGSSVNYSTNNMNQYTEVGGILLSYDQNGNMLSDGLNTYRYDYDNRLLQVTSPKEIVNYTYDVFGRRLTKSISDKITKYVYDGDRIIKEVIPSNGTRHYIYGTSLDEILSMVRTDTGAKYYYHLNGLGSVSNITGSSGNIVESYEYNVYGNPDIKDGSGAGIDKSSILNPYMFTGRPFDHVTGMYDYRARAYNPNIGRFLQTDPLGQVLGSSNLYSYVWNNPVNFIDPSGLQPQTVALIAIAAIIIAINLHPDFQTWRAMRQRLDQEMNNDIYQDYSPDAQKELDSIRTYINSHYSEHINTQCNTAALNGFKALLENFKGDKLKHVQIRGSRFRGPGKVDMNVIEIVPRGRPMLNTILIYLGPGAGDQFVLPTYMTVGDLYNQGYKTAREVEDIQHWLENPQIIKSPESMSMIAPSRTGGPINK